MHYLRDLGQVSLSHALLARMSNADWGHVRGRMRADLEDCYAAGVTASIRDDGRSLRKRESPSSCGMPA